MLLWIVRVVCQYTFDVLDLGEAAVMLLWASVGLHLCASGPQWACGGAALEPSGTVVGLLWTSVGLL